MPGLWFMFSLISLISSSQAFAAGESTHNYNTLLGFLGLGIVATLGLEQLNLWYRRRSETAALWLSLTAFGATLRIISTTLPALDSSPSALRTAILQALEYSSIGGTAIAFNFFLFKALDIPRIRWFASLQWTTGGLLTLLPLVSPYRFYGQLLGVYQAYILGCYAIFGVLIVRSFLQGKKGAYHMLWGYACVSSCILFDIFAVNRLQLTEVSLSPLGCAAFLLSQGLFLSQQAAAAFTRSEELALKLAEQERARTIFFHNTSHELRTPLNGILGFLELILRDHYAPISERLRTPLEQALQLAESLKLQVNTILDLARMRSGRQASHNHSFRLRNLQQAADTLASALLTRHEQSSFTSDYKDLEGSGTFVSDKEKILTIIRNLLGNAFKFAAEDRSNRVHLSLIASAENLTLQVKDTGIGIPQAMQEKVFEEFAQVDTSNRRPFEGTGLGLALVRELCRRMQATLSLESIEGVGSTFTVIIPRMATEATLSPEQTEVDEQDQLLSLQAPLPRQEAKDVAIRMTPTSQDGQSYWKILLVDDHISNLQLLADILSSDYEVIVAESGIQALERMAQWSPDLVLLDMMMPQMSGEDLLKHMKHDARLQDIPVVLITAQASEEDRLYALRLGADDYLAKPILIDELRLRVRNILQRQQGLKERERLEIQDKMAQLGLLFSDLSHEMKNMLHGASTIKPLAKEDVGIALAPISISEQLKLELALSLQARTQNAAIGQRLQAMSAMMQDEYTPIRQQIQGLIAASALSDSDVSLLWSEVQLLEPDELVFFENQLRLLSGFQTLIGLTEHARHLAFSVLSFARSGQTGSGHSELQQVWSDFNTLIQARSRQASVRWDVTMQTVDLPIATGSLLQIFMNLSMNAMDAIQSLPERDKWISCQVTLEQDLCVIRFSNGGPAIPVATQAHLFDRGFTTKGESGSGLGLAVSRRLVAQAGGDLRYDSQAQHPSFVLSFPILKATAEAA